MLRDELSKYCAETFDLELEQFDAEFFVDFIAKELGPLFYNAGIEEAIRTIRHGASVSRKRWI